VGLVDRTSERGLVRREQGTRDRRQVNVRLTDEGSDLLRRLVEMHRGQLDRMTEDLRPPQLR
jgi:DNA-binding MarR family transcriptional regulator